MMFGMFVIGLVFLLFLIGLPVLLVTLLVSKGSNPFQRISQAVSNPTVNPTDYRPTMSQNSSVETISRTCTNCGAGLQSNWSHCPQCGAPIQS